MKPVADQIARMLQQCAVEVMFSQCRPSRLLLSCEDLGIRQISCRTENTGGAAADAYPRVSRRIGVVCVHNGPVATLLVPPLAESR